MFKFFGKKSSKAEQNPDAPELGRAKKVSVTETITASPKTSKAQKKSSKVKKSFSIYPGDAPGEGPLLKPDIEHKRHLRLLKRIRVQGIIIIILFIVLSIAHPLFKTSYVYYGRQINAPIGSEKRLTELNEPVLTKEAILSWATSSATELLTYNFANFSDRILTYRNRFDDEGWINYLKALNEANTIQQFRTQQLVATAAPTAPATIEHEGINLQTNIYEWRVKVPVVRKFVTNNNVSVAKSVDVTMTLKRTPVTVSPSGISIITWFER
jgi:hypothetical protein